MMDPEGHRDIVIDEAVDLRNKVLEYLPQDVYQMTTNMSSTFSVAIFDKILKEAHEVRLTIAYNPGHEVLSVEALEFLNQIAIGNDEHDFLHYRYVELDMKTAEVYGYSEGAEVIDQYGTRVAPDEEDLVPTSAEPLNDETTAEPTETKLTSAQISDLNVLEADAFGTLNQEKLDYLMSLLDLI